MQGHKIIIAGGGTGGHIFPAIAIARALERLEPGIQLLFAGATGRMEMEKVPQAGYDIRGLDIAGLNRSQWWKNISLPFKIIKSLNQAKSILKTFAPDVVVGVGGYSSFPVLRAAQKSGIPTLIQEQNSFAGKANKALAKKAKTICVAYENMDRFFPKEKIVFTGNPVRENIVNNKTDLSTARSKFGLQPEKKTLFAVGGSLGAKAINEALANGYRELLQHDIQILWQTGKSYHESALDATKGNEDRIKVTGFISAMEMAYAASDVIISRAGASTIAELCVAGKPVILVPSPFVAEDHQTRNALSLVQKNAALLVTNAEAEKQLIPKVIELMENKELQQTLSANIKKLAIINGSEHIAKEVLKLI